MLSEFSLGLLFIFIPLWAGGGVWFMKTFYQAQCAHLSFSEARAKTIATHHTSAATAHLHGMQQRVEYRSLEDLDLNKSSLSLHEWGQEASHLWEDVSHSLQQLQDFASSNSSLLSSTGQNSKLLSTDVPEDQLSSSEPP